MYHAQIRDVNPDSTHKRKPDLRFENCEGMASQRRVIAVTKTSRSASFCDRILALLGLFMYSEWFSQSKMGGHFTVKRTLTRTSERYYWNCNRHSGTVYNFWEQISYCAWYFFEMSPNGTHSRSRRCHGNKVLGKCQRKTQCTTGTALHRGEISNSRFGKT